MYKIRYRKKVYKSIETWYDEDNEYWKAYYPSSGFTIQGETELEAISNLIKALNPYVEEYLQEEYENICKVGFNGTFEDYIEYKQNYGGK